MLYYINLIFFYALLGFILESVVYKYYNINAHSSIFLGPYTFVYGFGMFFSLIFFKYINLKIKYTLLKVFILYISFIMITSIIELIGGHLIHYFLKIDKWNYEKHKYHLGKYLSLKNSLCWGFLVLFSIKFLHPFFHENLLIKIPLKTTIIILFIFFIDLIYLIKKIVKNF